jgi:hypothetical protein
MSKERHNQIINEAYKSYLIEDSKVLPNMPKEKMTEMGFRLTQEEFANKCKTDKEFSEKWGLKIEERELTPKERIELAGGKIQEKYPALVEMSIKICDEREIPAKLITLAYNNETIEIYE